MKFSLIQPTFRDLPDGWMKAARDWCLNQCDPLTGDSQHTVEHIIVTHEPVVFEKRVFLNTKVIVNPVLGSVPSWNAGARASTGDVLIAMADDLMSSPRWDVKLAAIVPEGPAVFEVEHEDQWGLLTHPFVTRAYYNRFGYLFHPDYTHVMADCEFTDVAKASGYLIQARHLHFPHLGPLHPAARRPATKGDVEFNEAQPVYLRRKAAGFPISSVLEVACR
jgi:hypothetical protein